MNYLFWTGLIKFTTNIHVCFYFRNNQRQNDSNEMSPLEIQSLCLFPDFKFVFILQTEEVPHMYRIPTANRNETKSKWAKRNRTESGNEKQIRLRCVPFLCTIFFHAPRSCYYHWWKIRISFFIIWLCIWCKSMTNDAKSTKNGKREKTAYSKKLAKMTVSVTHTQK